MRNFSFENQGANTYLVYQLKEDDAVDTISLGMLTNNKVPGLADSLYTQMNDNKYIKYNISSQISAKQLFYGVVNRKRLLSVFKGITNAMLTIEDYMISVNTVVLDLEHIFVDASTYDVSMICVPVSNIEESVDLYDFIKEIMFSTQFDQSENCDYVTKIINFLNSGAFSIGSFKVFVEDLMSDSSSASAPAPVSAPTPAPASVPVQQPAPAPAAPVARPAAPQAAPAPKSAPKVSPAPKAAPVPKQAPKPVAPKTAPVKEPAQAPVADSSDKISILYLLQHYNKENVAKYKAQKEAKKQSGKKPAPAKPAPKAAPAPNVGFAIPGQEAPVKTAAPKTAPVPTPAARPAAPAPARPAAPAKPAAAPAAAPVRPAAPQPAARPAAPAAPVRPAAPQNLFVPNMADFDDEGDEKTMLIGEGGQFTPMEIPHLIRVKTGEKVQVRMPVFKIGRNSELNDYNLTDNKFIGHCHCHIVTRNGQYFVIDDNSQNHTYIDGVMITASTEVEITHGQMLRLADEEFEFKLY